MKKEQLKVQGMHCHGCEMLIKLTLEEITGVTSASANHQSGIVEVEFDPEKVSIDTLKLAIENAGYKVLD